MLLQHVVLSSFTLSLNDFMSEACLNPTMLLSTLVLLHPVRVLFWHTGVALLVALELVIAQGM